MQINTELFDVAIIGGGINGAGIAADAAGRGLSVALIEQNDLASATSSNSSKLIHGGLRYLEQYEFKLVKEALAEREVLLNIAPHIITPLRFMLPHQPHLRPAWMIRLGLFLYDHLASRSSLAASKSIVIEPDSPLVSDITKGFEYSDAWVDDARLVLLNAKMASQHGAKVLTHTQCIKAQRVNSQWQIRLKDMNTMQQTSIGAKALVNATGPWVASLFDSALSLPSPKQVRLVKGSHIVVLKLHNDKQAYILQNEDNRIVFILPYEQYFTLIGTTDEDYQGDPAKCRMSEQERDYLINISNRYMKRKITPADIVSSFSGVRPLLFEQGVSAQDVTRDYTLTLDAKTNQAPLMSVFGGKITTYRSLAEQAVNQLSQFFSHIKGPWTKDCRLPGGDIESLDSFIRTLYRQYPWLDKALLQRFARTYGSLTYQLLEHAHSIEDMGELFGHDLFAREVAYLIDHEWACSVEDILWRRTKVGLFINKRQQQKIEQYISHYLKLRLPQQAQA
ncbi:glycerol-3-phosphate dehydrogenase [Thalassotalea aquiviva]|uniref:glycerol-3-phosphate dehydrogenase n=1 Tax=Thalassotalea aquiviva TaxID=3242415 RepID=UPI00352AE021